MRLAMATLYYGSWYGHYEGICGPAKREYAERRGYAYRTFDQLLDPGRPPSWNKIPAIRQLFQEGYDAVLWHDSDTVLWNDLNIIEHLDRYPDKSLIWERNHEAPNAGAFLIRNNEWSKTFLDRIWEKVEFVHDRWWEQAAMIRELSDRNGDPNESCFGYEDGRSFLQSYSCYRPETWRSKLLVHFPNVQHNLRVWGMEYLVWLSKQPRERCLNRREDMVAWWLKRGLRKNILMAGHVDPGWISHVLRNWPGTVHLMPLEDRFTDPAILELVANYRERCIISKAALLWGVEEFPNGHFDIAYLDGNQDMGSVSEDIMRLAPKVHGNGVLAGHDFWSPAGCEVHRAVIDAQQNRIRGELWATIDSVNPSWAIILPDGLGEIPVSEDIASISPEVGSIRAITPVLVQRPVEVSIDTAHSALIMGLVLSLKPARVLELGLGSGITGELIVRCLEYNGIGAYTLVEGFVDSGGSRTTDPTWLRTTDEIVASMESDYVSKSESGQFDFILSDADHLHAHLHVANTIRICRPGGIVVWHDTANSSFPSLAEIPSRARNLGCHVVQFNRESRADERTGRGLTVAFIPS
jgi:predicted O-methyltransferase YrrM